MMFQKRKRICDFCGEEYWSGSPTGRVCEKPECQAAYQEERRRKQRERQRMTPRDKELEQRRRENEKRYRKSSKNIREDVMRAEEMGLSYGQYKARYKD